MHYTHYIINIYTLNVIIKTNNFTKPKKYYYIHHISKFSNTILLMDKSIKNNDKNITPCKRIFQCKVQIILHVKIKIKWPSGRKRSLIIKEN